MRGAVLLSLLVGVGCPWGSAHRRAPTPVAPAIELPARADALARGFLLRARVAEARGDLDEAHRSWAWVARLDRGPWASVHRADFLRRQGQPAAAIEAYDAALARDPGHPDAGFGRALLDPDPRALDPWVVDRPCRVAGEASGAVRSRAEALCVGL